MHFHYDKESDSLYIELAPQPSFDSEEVAEGVVIDYDKAGRIVGLDIEHASKHTDLGAIQVRGFLPELDVRAKL